MAPVTTEAIAVHDLSKSYATRGGAVVALDRTTFDVAEGEFVSVVGPSGCGEINKFDPAKVAAEAKAWKP